MEDFSGSVQIEMPKYRCHKEAWALRIGEIKPSCGDRAAQFNEEADGGAIITPYEADYAPFKVSADYVRKHKPSLGGYYVKYKDGYESFSPSGAFLDGYSLID